MKKDKIQKCCLNCKKNFEVKHYRKNTAKYCSIKCATSSEERNKKLSRNLTGRKLNKKHKDNIGKGLIGKQNGDKNPGWKGGALRAHHIKNFSQYPEL